MTFITSLINLDISMECILFQIKYCSIEHTIYTVAFSSFKFYVKRNSTIHCQNVFHLSPCFRSDTVSFVWFKRK